MLSKITMTKIDLEISRESLLGKTFKITDIEPNLAVYLKDEENNEYVLTAAGHAKLDLRQFQTPEERIDYLEDLVITLIDKLNLSEDQLHEDTLNRLYGDSDE